MVCICLQHRIAAMEKISDNTLGVAGANRAAVEGKMHDKRIGANSLRGGFLQVEAENGKQKDEASYRAGHGTI
jgi:hypothetical protein